MSVISNLSENEAHDALNQMVINFSLNTWKSYILKLPILLGSVWHNNVCKH